MTSLSLYQNKKRRTNSPSFLPHINETILLMGPHLGRISVHRMWFRTAFCFSSRVKSTGVSHSTCRSSFLWHAITIPRTAESLQSLSLSLSLSYIYICIYILKYFQSLLFKLTNQEYDEQSSQGKKDDNMTPFLFISESKRFWFYFNTSCPPARKSLLALLRAKSPRGPTAIKCTAITTSLATTILAHKEEKRRNNVPV